MAEAAEQHPLEILGYDGIQVLTRGTVKLSDHELPSARFKWMRVDPEDGVETGTGGVVWIRCASDERYLFVAGEAERDRFDARAVEAFVRGLRTCG
jgi:hypothetical protein